MPATKMCPSQDQLSDYVVGELNEQESDSITDHLKSCDDCISRLDDLNELSDVILGKLRCSSPVDSYMTEPQCQEAMHNSKRIGQKESTAGRRPDMLGNYRLVIPPLGKGGMGTVYRATHTKLQRDVAVKILPAGRMLNPDSVSRFEREMKAIGKLHHPNIVQAHDAGEASGQHYLAMELVQGVDLARIVHRIGPLPVADACEIIRQAATGLQHAHDSALVHRDIKPSNIMVTPSGAVKVLDLGLALLSEPIPDEHDLKSTGEKALTSGQVMGTVDYMAPEQIGDSHHVDQRVDIYGLGATLYQLLTGKAPYADLESPKPDYIPRYLAKLGAIATKPVTPVTDFRTDIPDELITVLDRMLAKNPDERFSSATEVALALAPLAHGAMPAQLVTEAESIADTDKRHDRSRTSTVDPIASSSTDTNRSRAEPKSARPSTSRCWYKSPVVAVVVVSLVACLVASIVIPRGDGELVIESMEPSVEVLIKQVPDGTVVKHWQLDQGENRWKIRSGEYEIVLIGEGMDGMRVDQNRITLVRGSQEVVSIYRKQDLPESATPTMPPQRISIKAGEPLSPTSFVRNPPALQGVLSWTIASRHARSYIYAVAYSPNGRLIAGAGQDSTIRIWDSGTRSLVRILVGHESPVFTLSWSPDGRYLVSGGVDKHVRVWEVASGRLVVTIPTRRSVVSLDWSPTGKLIAFNDDNDIILWSPESRSARSVLSRHSHPVQSVAWSPDGNTLASGSDDALLLWDTSSRTSRGLEGHQGGVSALAWSPDGNVLLSYNADPGELRFWSIDNESIRYRAEATPWAASHSLAWSRDGRTIVTVAGGESTEIEIWISHWRRYRQVPQAGSWTPPISVDISPDGKTLVCGNSNGGIALLDVASNSTQDISRSIGPLPVVDWALDERKYTAVLRDGTRGINAMLAARQSWPPDGSMLAGIHNREIVIWDNYGKKTTTLTGHEDEVNSISWASEGMLASGDREGNVRVWETDTGRPVHAFKADDGPVSVCLAPNGRFLAFRSVHPKNNLLDQKVQIRSLGCNKTQVLGVAHPGMAWSPDGRLFAYGRGKIVDAEKYEVVKTLRPWKTYRESVLAWSPSGEVLVSGVSFGHWNGELNAWNVKTGERRTLLAGDPISSACFSEDGKVVACGGGSGSIWFCEAATGKLRGFLRILDDQYVVISPNGHYRGSPGIEDELRYVVQTEEGQVTLTPNEFAKNYGWKNDPGKVRLARIPFNEA